MNYQSWNKARLIKEIKRLDREISALKGEAYQKIKKADQLKSKFLSSVSHELRIPLTSIRAFSNILLTYEEDDEATRREFLEIISSESDRLTRLINELLDLSKIEAGRMEWKDKILNLAEVTSASVTALAGVAREKSIKLIMDESAIGVRIKADRDRIQQVITNLVGNAIKFSPRESPIKITLDPEGGNGEKWVKVSVSDQGPGIAPEIQETIFEKFRQSGLSQNGKTEGTGLGLSICREIVNHYGGKIWVANKPGKGSTFSFTLPLL